MEKKISRTVKICDRCEGEIERQRNILMFVCPVCGRECCNYCSSNTLFSNYPDVCKDCSKIDWVKKSEDKYTKRYYKQLRDEEAKLKRLACEEMSKNNAKRTLRSKHV